MPVTVRVFPNAIYNIEQDSRLWTMIYEPRSHDSEQSWFGDHCSLANTVLGLAQLAIGGALSF